jgi:hypothetical protein
MYARAFERKIIFIQSKLESKFLLSWLSGSLRGLSCEAKLASAQSHDRVDCMDGHESAKVVVMYNTVYYARSVV